MKKKQDAAVLSRSGLALDLVDECPEDVKFAQLLSIQVSLPLCSSLLPMHKIYIQKNLKNVEYLVDNLYKKIVQAKKEAEQLRDEGREALVQQDIFNPTKAKTEEHTDPARKFMAKVAISSQTKLIKNQGFGIVKAKGANPLGIVTTKEKQQVERSLHGYDQTKAEAQQSDEAGSGPTIHSPSKPGSSKCDEKDSNTSSLLLLTNYSSDESE